MSFYSVEGEEVKLIVLKFVIRGSGFATFVEILAHVLVRYGFKPDYEEAKKAVRFSLTFFREQGVIKKRKSSHGNAGAYITYVSKIDFQNFKDLQ